MESPMIAFALNHMTVPDLPWRDFLDLAQRLGCVGVEFRNDLTRPLFDHAPPELVASEVRSRGLRIVGLSQLYPFNVWTPDRATELTALIEMAQACEAETISLIPQNEGLITKADDREAHLRTALTAILPALRAAQVTALVEPLGFDRSSLRFKGETLAAIQAIGGSDRLKLVHDTFHHHLSGEDAMFPLETGIVHISGVVDPTLAANRMEDEDRVLVDARDQLDNIEQLAALLRAGYDGPVSVEAFSPEIHALPDPEPALRAQFSFIHRSLEPLIGAR